ncbi:hypothetical protein [Algoriphagus sp. AK58]|uniref:hypothetical protein n=1 Tax=Algoriphagus sp. AK58 TaxID=1406877 RepID=UPI00164F4F0D|nr:hypothetical protein [Algoriphagus sp. AK58]MBC6368716.1 hypothetical protein [Algoriphagus sp. AK58]
MTIKQAIKYSLIYILTILFGAFIAFKVWWTNGDARFLGIIAFFLIGFGSLFLSISLTRIIIPTKTDFSFSTLSDKKKYQILKDTVGSTKVKIISASYISLFLILFAGTAYKLVTSLNKYEKDQLKTFGRLQKVRINDIHFKGKGTPYALFDFYLDGKKYSNDLNPKNYSIGDSATIIFSTNNTDIVKWEEDFDKNNE